MPKKLIVIDPGMTQESGHHYSYNLAIKNTCAELGVECLFLFSAETPPELLARFPGARAKLGEKFYELNPKHEEKAASTLEDLRACLGAADLRGSVIFAHTSSFYLALALLEFLQLEDGLTGGSPKELPERLPSAFSSALPNELPGESPSALPDELPADEAFSLYLNFLSFDPAKAAERLPLRQLAAFNQPAARRLKARLRLAGCSVYMAGLLEELLPGFKVSIMPAPLETGSLSAGFRPDKTLRFGFIGEGRPDKNLEALATGANLYLEAGGRGSFYFQVMPTSTKVMPDMLAVYELAKKYPEQCGLKLGTFNSAAYYTPFSKLDFIVLPYSRQPSVFSGVLQDALALGVSPLITGGNSMPLEAERAGAGFALLEAAGDFPTAQEICNGLARAAENPAQLRIRSLQASRDYKNYNSPRNLVLTLLGDPAAVPPRFA